MTEQEFVYAQKGKLPRRFTKIAWTKMGKDKNGWKETPPEVQAEIQKKAKEKAADLKNLGAKGTAEVDKSGDTPAAKETPQAQTQKSAAELRKDLEAAEAREAAEENTSSEDAQSSEDDNDTPPKYLNSTDEELNVTETVKKIKGMKTSAEISKYVEGETRSTVNKAAAKFIAELK